MSVPANARTDADRMSLWLIINVSPYTDRVFIAISSGRTRTGRDSVFVFISMNVKGGKFPAQVGFLKGRNKVREVCIKTTGVFFFRVTANSSGILETEYGSYRKKRI